MASEGLQQAGRNVYIRLKVGTDSKTVRYRVNYDGDEYRLLEYKRVKSGKMGFNTVARGGLLDALRPLMGKAGNSMKELEQVYKDAQVAQAKRDAATAAAKPTCPQKRAAGNIKQGQQENPALSKKPRPGSIDSNMLMAKQGVWACQHRRDMP